MSKAPRIFMTPEEIIVEKLGFKAIRGENFNPPRYDLGEYGTKTAIGVIAVIKRIAEEAKDL